MNEKARHIKTKQDSYYAQYIIWFQVSCPYCNGTGYVTQQMGGFYMQSTCGRCRGTGFFNKNPCLQCEGHGRTVQQRTVTVNIPAGINDGETVRMPVGKVILKILL